MDEMNKMDKMDNTIETNKTTIRKVIRYKLRYETFILKPGKK